METQLTSACSGRVGRLPPSPVASEGGDARNVGQRDDHEENRLKGPSHLLAVSARIRRDAGPRKNDMVPSCNTQLAKVPQPSSKMGSGVDSTFPANHSQVCQSEEILALPDAGAGLGTHSAAPGLAPE